MTSGSLIKGTQKKLFEKIKFSKNFFENFPHFRKYLLINPKSFAKIDPILRLEKLATNWLFRIADLAPDASQNLAALTGAGHETFDENQDSV